MFIFEKIGNFFADKFIDFFSFLVNCSYYVALGVAVIALLLYCAGFKNSGKYISASLIIYFALECIKGFLNGTL